MKDSMIQIEDIKYELEEFEETIKEGVLKAKEHNINLSIFKDEIQKGLKYKNNEDQWTFDYQSYLSAIARGNFHSPKEWAEDYYQSYWLS